MLSANLSDFNKFFLISLIKLHKSVNVIQNLNISITTHTMVDCAKDINNRLNKTVLEIKRKISYNLFLLLNKILIKNVNLAFFSLFKLLKMLLFINLLNI